MRRYSIGFLIALTIAAHSSPLAAGLVGKCVGDCNADGRVSVGELVTAVGIALGDRSIDSCAIVDSDSSGTVEVGELINAVGNALEGCPGNGAVFVIRACASAEDPDGQTFRVFITDPETITQAQGLIGAGQTQILSGSLLPGDGGFNAPWSWHHDPATVGFSDFTIELCDGCPMFVEEDLEYWLDVVGTYCPWSTEVLGRVR